MNKNSRPTISALIIAKNEELMLANCLETLRWCDEVIVIDNNSHDNTVGIAKQWGAKVYTIASDDFSYSRNQALSKAKTDWVFYIDADERVTPRLSQEILVHIETHSAAVLRLKRQNMMYGAYFQHGGWQGDNLERAFLRKNLQKWTGKVHESPHYSGEVIDLHQELLHLTHRNTRDGLLKSADWTKIEANLLHESGVAPVSLFTLLRKSSMEFLRRAFFQGGYKDGMPGIVEALVQGMNRFLVYVQVWELQQQPSLEKKYIAEEKRIAELWKNQ